MLNGAGSRVAFSYWRAALIQAEIGAGRLDEARALLDDTLAFVESSDERYFEPELHRIAGSLALARGGADDPKARDEAGQAFRKALEIAERQGALGLVARAQESIEAGPAPE
jgi:hypothetical protein